MAPDHVLRTNIHIIMNSKEFSPSEFVESTFGCHHLNLINHIATIWNTLLDRHSPNTACGVVSHLANTTQPQRLPILQNIPSQKTFGFVSSAHALHAFDEYIKTEDTAVNKDLVDITECSEERWLEILHELDVDVKLVNTPAIPTLPLIPIDPILLNQPNTSLCLLLPPPPLQTIAAKTEIMEVLLDSQGPTSVWDTEAESSAVIVSQHSYLTLSNMLTNSFAIRILQLSCLKVQLSRCRPSLQNSLKVRMMRFRYLAAPR